MVTPTEMGIVRLSSAKPYEMFSTIAPTNAAIKPIIYSKGKSPTLGVKKTTMLALMKKDKVPSKLFLRNFRLPNFLPINAAVVSLIINIVKAVTKITLGKINAHIKADKRT